MAGLGYEGRARLRGLLPVSSSSLARLKSLASWLSVSLLRWLLCAVVLAVVLGRLRGVISPVMAAMAPAVCSICHGCPIRPAERAAARSHEGRHQGAGHEAEGNAGYEGPDHGEAGHEEASLSRVCDCEACQLVAAGMRQSGSSAHEPTHDMGAGAEEILASPLGWALLLAGPDPPGGLSWLISWPAAPALRSAARRPPPTPPPRAALA